VNARVFSRPISSMERYAYELTRRLDGRQITLTRQADGLYGVPGHAREQLALPRRVNGCVLWSSAGDR